MATTQSRTEEEVTCPLCEDYSGAPSSVEAHISRKTDEAHKGQVGQMYSEELEDSPVESAAIVPVEGESSESTSSESTSSESNADFSEESHEDGGRRSADTDGEAGDLVDDEPESEDAGVVEVQESDTEMNVGWEPAIAEMESRVDGLAGNFTSLYDELVAQEQRLAELERRVDAIEETNDEPVHAEQDGSGDRDGVAEDDESGSVGIPIPVSTSTLVAGGLAVVLALWWLRSGSSGGSEETGQQAQQASQSDDEVPLVESSGGLIEDAEEVF